MDHIHHSPSRRQFVVAAIAAFGYGLKPRWLDAQQQGIVEAIRTQAAVDPISVTKVRAGVYVLTGSGGNIAAYVGRKGTVLVDAGISVSRAKIESALSRINAKPVTDVINTHWHFDHTDGNEWLHAAGARIIGHRKALEHMATATRVDGWNFTFPPVPAGGRPSELIDANCRMNLSAGPADLEPYRPGHTDSDLRVTLSDEDVIHAGDTWWNGFFPFIDYSTGGSIDGTIRAVGDTLRAAGSRTIVIPGHGPVGGRTELLAFLDMLSTVRDTVSASKRLGHSLAEVLAAQPTKAFDAKWGGFAINGNTFAALVYAGV